MLKAAEIQNYKLWRNLFVFFGKLFYSVTLSKLCAFIANTFKVSAMFHVDNKNYFDNRFFSFFNPNGNCLKQNVYSVHSNLWKSVDSLIDAPKTRRCSFLCIDFCNESPSSHLLCFKKVTTKKTRLSFERICKLLYV